MKRFVGFLACVGAFLMVASSCTAPPPTGPVDLMPPNLVSVDITPNEVTPGQTMKITATVSDNVGVTSVAFLVGRNGTPSGFCSGNAVLVGGTPTLGTWERSCIAPPMLNAGTYEVGTVAVDARLNAVSTSQFSPPEIRGLFTVLGDTDDSDAPQVQSVTTSPATATRGSEITISAHVVDASGASNVAFVVRRFRATTMEWCAAGATLVSGTATDGVWELTCLVGAQTPLGEYRVSTAAADVLNNFGGIGDDGADAVAGPFTVIAAP